jgi:endogenous inhibitor of DNA gyrase (YacG/DUF329 family)
MSAQKSPAPVNDNAPPDAAADNEVASSGTCPICAKPRLAAYKPFCSKRCADVDLNRWLQGAYAVPVVEEDGGHSDDGA